MKALNAENKELHPAMLITAPRELTNEDLTKFIGIPITYKGKPIGHVDEALHFYYPNEATLNGTIYNEKYFREVVQPDCDICSLEWQVEKDEFIPCSVAFVEGSAYPRKRDVLHQ